MSNVYNIGTRDSLLAMTQSQQVKEELEKLTGKQFHLIPLKTQGDLDTSTPLWQLEGENFFTKELDHALISKKVDFVVHSYKDLGSKRPEPITLGAITKRSYSQDILLIPKTKINAPHLNIGTSSPRRVINIEKNLQDLIPGKPQIKCTSIRGNVNTRIQKLRDGHYDAIVLALAGLERLASSNDSLILLQELLQDLHFMILPESLFPSAAAQGALAIECLKERKDVIEMLQVIHHQQTAEIVKRERQAFNEYGGGCHLAVGIQVYQVDDNFLHIHQGDHNGPIAKRFIEKTPCPPLHSQRIFVGTEEKNIQRSPLLGTNNNSCRNKIVSSKYCLEWLQHHYQNEFLWAAGNKTMKRLVNAGFWVNGSMDSLGEGRLKEIFESKVISLLLNNQKSICSLSHAEASSTFGKPLACYQNEFSPNPNIELYEVYYWNSFKQYLFHKNIVGDNIDQATHCCGLGKTYRAFRENNINVIPFFGVEEFKKWIDHE